MTNNKHSTTCHPTEKMEQAGECSSLYCTLDEMKRGRARINEMTVEEDEGFEGRGGRREEYIDAIHDAHGNVYTQVKSSHSA